jgi:hypothetical protein
MTPQDLVREVCFRDTSPDEAEPDWRLERRDWEDKGFWEAFQSEMGCLVTQYPLRDMIPYLRHLIDESWRVEDTDIKDNIRSLLYYAWDRAREVETLQRRFAEAQMRLLALTAGSA